MQIPARQVPSVHGSDAAATGSAAATTGVTDADDARTSDASADERAREAARKLVDDVPWYVHALDFFFGYDPVAEGITSAKE